MSLVFFGYVISAFLAGPDWSEVGRQIAKPNFEFHSGYLFTVMALIGTTIDARSRGSSSTHSAICQSLRAVARAAP